MAVKTGIVTINGIQAIECDSDPSIGGLIAAIGSYASATDGSGIFYKSASSNTAWTQVIMPSTIPTRITNLENNVYKVTYFQIVTGTSGSLTLPTGATINEGQFGLSGNAVLSKINVSNLPTFQSPTTSGGVIVTASLNASTGAWVASGVYTDGSVALIYSINISALNYHNLDTSKIINEVQQNSLTSSEFGTFIYSQASKSTLADNDEFILSDSQDSNKAKSALWSSIKTNLQTAFNSIFLKSASNLSDLSNLITARTTNLRMYDVFMTNGNQSTTSNVASNITDLVTPTLAANKRYKIRGVLHIGCDNTGGVKIQITVPTGTTLFVTAFGKSSSNAAFAQIAITSSATLTAVGYNTLNDANGFIFVEGEISLSSTAGTAQFGFASVVNTQTSTMYQLGTQLTVTQIN